LTAWKSPYWIGEEAGYRARHERIYKARGKAKYYQCVDCLKKQASDWALEHGKSGFDPFDYKPLCRRCHILYDQAKLNWPAVRRIRALAFREEVSQDDLARLFEVTKRNIRLILWNVIWHED
jgi:NAD-dependent SIR2 family protein deacetylase